MTKTSKLLKYFSVTALAMSKIQKVSSMTMLFFKREVKISVEGQNFQLKKCADILR